MRYNKREKGNSIILFPDEYVMLDIETTGLSPEWDSILEIGAIRIKNGVVDEEFHTFVEYGEMIPAFITALTGITNDMLIGAPPSAEAIKSFRDFLKDSIIVGYNVNFDVNFLYDYSLKFLDLKLTNDYVDCMRISKKLYPDEPHHRLKDMVQILGIDVSGAHRALDDCYTTVKILDCFHQNVLEKYESEESFYDLFKKHGRSLPKLNANDIVADKTDFDVTHPLYGKMCVFTGTLEKMIRKEAMQAVVNVGGLVENNVTRKTNFLILGNNDYCSTIKGGKSSKQKKAEELIEKGYDLTIIPENEFYDLIITYGSEKDLNMKDESDMFGCCGKYKECSAAGKCLRDDDRADSCWYKKNLEAGKIFY